MLDLATVPCAHIFAIQVKLVLGRNDRGSGPHTEITTGRKGINLEARRPGKEGKPMNLSHGFLASKFTPPKPVVHLCVLGVRFLHARSRYRSLRSIRGVSEPRLRSRPY